MRPCAGPPQHRSRPASSKERAMIRSRTLAVAALVAGLLPIGGGVRAADPPITLRLATPEDPDRPSQTFIDRFVSGVEAASGGSMSVEVLYAAGGHDADKEPVVAGRVQSGDV